MAVQKAIRRARMKSSAPELLPHTPTKRRIALPPRPRLKGIRPPTPIDHAALGCFHSASRFLRQPWMI